jgi:hypothetical protein
MPSRERRLRQEQQGRIQEKYFPVTPDGPLLPPPEEEETPMASPPGNEAPRYHVRFVLPGQGSLTYRGSNYDYAELLTLAGTPRDEQLVRLGYVSPVDKAESHLHAQCGVCERWFLTEYSRDMHGRRRHQERFAEDDLEVGGGLTGPEGGTGLRDLTGDAEERRLMQENPLFLEKTKASQQG